jgi:hypothetical protein
MCGISASFSAETFRELVSLNQSRGEFSFSYTRFFTTGQDFQSGNLTDHVTRKGFGKFEFAFDEPNPKALFHLGHCQAPTGGLIKDPERIHPATYKGFLLYHNGVLKDHEVKFLQDDLVTPLSWDTGLFLQAIATRGIKSLSETLSSIDGSFACILYKEGESKFYVFRSKAAILFIDDKLSISSSPFPFAKLLDSDIIYELDLIARTFTQVGIFRSKSSPYLIDED